MATKMKKAEILAQIKSLTLAQFKEVIDNLDGMQVGDNSFVIPQTIEGEQKWCKIDFTAKDTITNDLGEKVSYDPEIEIDRWDFDREDKAQRKAEREDKHAKIVKRDLERKAKAKEKAELAKLAKEKSAEEKSTKSVD